MKRAREEGCSCAYGSRTDALPIGCLHRYQNSIGIRIENGRGGYQAVDNRYLRAPVSSYTKTRLLQRECLISSCWNQCRSINALSNDTNFILNLISVKKLI